jgi:hypothetical protein
MLIELISLIDQASEIMVVKFGRVSLLNVSVKTLVLLTERWHMNYPSIQNGQIYL